MGPSVVRSRSCRASIEPDRARRHKGVPAVGVKHVEPYTEEWLRQPALYVSRVVGALGAEAVDWWEGPCDPRTVTILLTGGDALVWDEESGWRRGRYVSGDRGLCTVLAEARYLGGGLLLRPE